MSKQSKSRKSLWLGILAVVVLLTMVLCGCNNEQAAPTTTAPVATGGEEATAEVDLYWNIDRALYDGKSEAGMSSREPAEDGYFHVRFFKDGEIVELRVADRKTVNALEVNDLMGLEFDDDGIVVGISSVDDLPIEQIAWQFYVQSVGGKLIKTNSSASMNGMEVLIETDENTGIYDMSGVTGEIGKIDKPSQGDRVMVVGDEDGNVTHVFVYERPNYMNSHEGECKHCKQTVTWLEWNKETIMPTTTGHYQLTADMTGVTQSNMVEDAKICLDLNGKRVDGASGRRIISMHNAGTELAIMDTSEAQTGRIAAHGQGDQGMCVWVRYGVFYLYEGILDGSDASTQKNSPTLNMGSNTYMYMYGGELIGGTSLPAPNGKGGWQAGISGTMQINTGAKFVMNGGLIHKGKAMAVVTKYAANGDPSTYAAGVGGNIVINGGLMEMNGGTVRDGYARSAGNIHLQGKGELIINGGLVSNGQAYGKGANGGNIYVSSNCNFTFNGGTIRNGKTFNCGGNVYFNGTFKMTDGIITDGKCYSWTTKEVNEAAASRNLFGVQGDLYMYGGRIAGGVQMIDSANDKNQTIVLVSARSVIFDEDGTGPHLTLSDTAGGTKCIMYVGPMHDEGKVGISKVQAAVFTEPTKKENADNFISDIEGADVAWSEDGLVLGKVHCMCSQDPDIADDAHKLGCDKVQYAWAPWTGTALPTNGNFYLTANIDKAGGATIPSNANLRLDLNGYTATKVDGYRMWSFRGSENATMTITDTSEAQTGTLKNIATAGTGTVQGGIVWAGGNSKDGTMNIIAGTLDVTDFRMMNCGLAIETGCSKGFELNMYGGTIKGGETVKNASTGGNNHGGSVYVNINSVFNMYGGLITGGRAHAGGQGGNVVVRGTMNMYGGTIKDGNPDHATSDSNIRIFGSSATSQATLNLYGGTVAGGIDTNNYLVQNTIRVSGDVVVDKNLTSSGCEKPTISLRGGCNFGGSFYPVEVGEMKAGASVYVTPVQPAFSTVTDSANAQYFHADAEGADVAWIDDPANFGLTDADKGKLFIGHVHCICGGSIPSGTKLADGTIHTCKAVAFAPADSLSHVEANTNVYLTKDVVLTGQVQMRGAYTLNICLCGHTITGAKNVRLFRAIVNGETEQPTDASAFNITTCDASYTDGATDKNALKVYGTSENDGGIFLINKGTVSLYRGTLNAGEYILTGTKDGSKYGGAINLTGSGKFVQYPNTTVIGGRADIVTGKKTGHGGAVAVNGGTYTMLGGTIKNGIGYQWGGNVHVQSGKFNMYDGLITGGKKINADGSLNPNSTLANVSIRAAGTFNMTGGTVDGRFENVHDVCNNINISGSAKVTYNGNIKGNTICVNKGVPNIGTLNDDAQIGLMYSGKLGEGKKVANILDLETFSMDKVAMNVWFSGITADYTYELKLVGNELWAYETTVTP